jgi:hypothetical protein
MIKHNPQNDISFLSTQELARFDVARFRSGIDNLMIFDVIKGKPAHEIVSLRLSRIKRFAPKLVCLCMSGETKGDSATALRYLGAKCSLAGTKEVATLFSAIGIMNLPDRLFAYGLLANCGGKGTRDKAVLHLLGSASKMMEPTKQKVSVLATAAAFASKDSRDFQKATTEFFKTFDEVYRTPAARQSFVEAFLKSTHGAESETFSALLNDRLLADKAKAASPSSHTPGKLARVAKVSDTFGLFPNSGAVALVF